LVDIKQRLPHAEILILTGYSSISTAVEAIKLGAVNYLCKPASAENIIQAFSVSDKPIESISASPTSISRLEWEHIQRVLNDNNGNISATARSLGMHRRTLQRKLQKKPSKT
jgi:two-component system response regulator RegA